VKRDSGRFACLLFLLASVPLIFAQTPEPVPEPPLQLLGPQLIAWSALQQPQPLQKFSSGSLESAPRNGAAEPKAETQAHKAQNFTGTIEHVGNGYVLRISSTVAYPLDDQEQARRYNGAQVRVSALVDANGESLRLVSIEMGL
jgi:hypothetical protein